MKQYPLRQIVLDDHWVYILLFQRQDTFLLLLQIVLMERLFLILPEPRIDLCINDFRFELKQVHTTCDSQYK